MEYKFQRTIYLHQDSESTFDRNILAEAEALVTDILANVNINCQDESDYYMHECLIQLAKIDGFPHFLVVSTSLFHIHAIQMYSGITRGSAK